MFSPVAARPFSASKLFGRDTSIFYRPELLTERILIRKLRTDYLEFAVYTPLSIDGTEWHRWFFSTRFTPSGGGLDLIVCTLARLYASTVIPANAENLTTGTQAQAATASKTTSQADSRTGVWTGPATVNGVTDIIYSITPGDKAVYSITPDADGRLVWRTLGNPSNGGIVRITAKIAGVEIASGYTIPDAGSGVRLVNLAATATGMQLIVVAEGCAAAAHTIEVEVHSSNPVNGRGYDGGTLAYGETEYDSVGRTGTWETRAIAGVNVPLSFNPGAETIYSFTGTRVGWQYGQINSGGKVDVRVYTALGVEIDPGDYDIVGNEVDTYGPVTAIRNALIASGLPDATYFVGVKSKPSKHASSSGYRIYDNGLIAYDEAAAGVLGTDEIDDLSMPPSPSSTADVGTHVLLGPGNVVYAASWREPGSSPGDESFVGGPAHGNETTPDNDDPVFEIGGSAIDWAGAAVGDDFVGKAGRFLLTGTLKFPDWDGILTAPDFATLERDWMFSRAGWVGDDERASFADGLLHIDYGVMIQAPNGGDSRSDGVGGALNTVWTDVPADEFTLDASDNSSTALGARRGFVFVGPGYAACVAVAGYSGRKFGSALLRDLNTHHLKAYCERDIEDPVNGVLVPAGDVSRVRKSWRVLKIAA